MALIIGPENTSFAQRLGSSLGSGLGQGLSMLAQNKLNEMRRSKVSDLLKGAGYEPGQSDLLAYLQQQQPEHFHQVLGQQQQANSLKQQKSDQAHQLKMAQFKEKLRPNLDYLNGLETTLNRLEDLVKKDDVYFGLIPSKLPTSLLNADTGEYDALSNLFHTDAAKNQTGVRSVYHVKILGASKPGLDKTKKQNEQILSHWRRILNDKRSKFIKAHPEFSEDQEMSASSGRQEFNELPNPQQFPNKKLTAPDGRQFISNGQQWVPLEG